MTALTHLGSTARKRGAAAEVTLDEVAEAANRMKVWTEGYAEKPAEPTPVDLMPRLVFTARPAAPTGLEGRVQARMADCRTISEMADPIERNRQITAKYAELSRELDDVIDHGRRLHPNWSTFASHASATVGRTMRGEDLPGTRKTIQVAGQLVDMAGGLIGGAIGTVLRGFKMPSVTAHIQERDLATRYFLGEGNNKVFSEIGQEFAIFAETFKGDTAPDQAKFDQYAKHFSPEQSTLKDAFQDYWQGMFETDEKRKEELFWAANCLAGSHEQRRLQEQIAAALPWGGHRFFTQNMSLVFPDGEIRLSKDLPKRPDGRDYPVGLENITYPRAFQVINDWDKTRNGLKASGAGDWARLDDRMNFIVDLFRTHADDGKLFENPVV
jgi:hypothetical protein